MNAQRHETNGLIVLAVLFCVIEKYEQRFGMLRIILIIVGCQVKKAFRVIVTNSETNALPAARSSGGVMLCGLEPAVKSSFAREKHIEYHIDIFANQVGHSHSQIVSGSLVHKPNSLSVVE